MNIGVRRGARGGSRARGRGCVRAGRSVRGRGRGISVVPQDIPAIPRRRNQQRETEVFFQATSSNLPQISCFLVAEYFQNLMSSELRQSKDQISSSADYGDTAIGYVKVKRDGSVCTVRASITPQTSVNNTPYAVSVDIDEQNETISNATCTCQATAAVIKYHLNQVRDEDKIIVEKLAKSLVVDNCVTSVNSITELEIFKLKLTQLMADACMEL